MIIKQVLFQIWKRPILMQTVLQVLYLWFLDCDHHCPGASSSWPAPHCGVSDSGRSSHPHPPLEPRSPRPLWGSAWCWPRADLESHVTGRLLSWQRSLLCAASLSVCLYPCAETDDFRWQSVYCQPWCGYGDDIPGLAVVSHGTERKTTVSLPVLNLGIIVLHQD